MPLPPLRGHHAVRETLIRAVDGGNLPQSILLHGPAGVGKERLALWIAQLVMCDAREAEPCGACAACRSIERLEHPDVHWFFPLPRPDASSPEKLREKLEESRADELSRRRADPYHPPAFDKAPAHFLAAVQTLQQLASMRPNLGNRAVFVVGDAELMVPQESSQEAANAFLKLLEEPSPAATMILTSSQPGALLPTIRSRLLALRVGPVPDDDIAALLTEGGFSAPDAAARIARRSRGSVTRAVRLAEAGSDAEADPDRHAARALLLAALSSTPAARLAAAHQRRPTGARTDLMGQLDALSEWLRDLLAVATGAPERVSDPDAVPILTRAVRQREIRPAGIMAGMERVAAARKLAYGNVNPQLILAELLAKLQGDLVVAAPPRRGGRR